MSAPQPVFDNSFVQALPADPKRDNQRRQVEGACFSRVRPTPVAAPSMVAFSPEVAELVGLDPTFLQSDKAAQVFSGNELLEGMDPTAACYGGHQFGHWAGQLGDGRAISLGEILRDDGRRWELQLKGAGPTPYSRTADGRAVMRSSVREFLCSEAMHHLGVPTTRALTLVSTGDEVLRDMFYDGQPAMEPGAIVCRVAPTFVRFGNFEIFASRNDHQTLRRLADYTIDTHFPELADGKPGKTHYGALFKEVCERTAVMVTHWMRVGFVHGVMNTDNMSILGLTIDYGPYGWLENYDPNWTPNTTDASGRRYRYGNQPRIAFWNLLRLADAFHDLVGDTELLEAGLKTYADTLEREQEQMFAAKLGIEARGEEDVPLIEELLAVLQLTETDMTIFYRRLADVDLSANDDEELLRPLTDAYYQPAELEGPHRSRIVRWLRNYGERVAQDHVPADARRARMNEANPKYVLRNYLAQLAIDEAEKGDGGKGNGGKGNGGKGNGGKGNGGKGNGGKGNGGKVLELLDVMRRPYDEQPGRETFAEKRPEWARHRPGCSMLSCSS